MVKTKTVKKVGFTDLLCGRAWRFGIATLVVFGALFGVQTAHASDWSQWLSQPTMTGDWGGVRTSLQALGITPHAYDLTEFAANVSGGKGRGSSTAEQIGFGVDFDMGKLAGINGGTVHLQLNYRQGASTSANFIGNENEVQSNFGFGEDLRLTQFSYEQLFDHGILDAQIGFFPAGNTFDNWVALGGDFQNIAFCCHEDPLFVNSGDSVYPSGKWGGSIKINATPTIYAETGVWEVNPTNALAQNGFKISLNGSTGVIFPVEFGWNPEFGSGSLPGNYKIGGYYDTSTVADVTHPQIMRSGRYGGYIMVNQMLINLQPGTSRGLIVFGQATISDERTATIPYFYNVGFILQGPFASRPTDNIAIGMARSLVNGHATREAIDLAAEEGQIGVRQPGETDVELGYGIRVAPWLLIDPNVQYIGSPGAFSSKPIKDAWVLATQAQINF
jgi:porin